MWKEFKSFVTTIFINEAAMFCINSIVVNLSVTKIVSMTQFTNMNIWYITCPGLKFGAKNL